jgi:hypothetical protein
MSRECVLAWGSRKGIPRNEMRVSNAEELDTALDEIECLAMLDSCVYQVDLTLVSLSIDDPLMIQFLIGHPARSSLMWHYDGITMIAVVSQLPLFAESIEYEHQSVIGRMNPEYTIISPSLVREALSVYLIANCRPRGLQWIEAEQD